MAKHNLLKKISLGIASLALICPLAMSGFNTNANASSRYYFNNVRHPHNPVERAFTRRGWTSGPMFDFTGAHITIYGRHYTVHGTSAVGGYLTLNGSRHHARRAHRVYRHRRRARKATRRRRGRRAKRTRKARRNHRRIARKAKRRPRITKAHKARRTHKHHVNNDSLLAAYEREAEDENTPTPVHHESQATWYKNNAVSLYNHNYYTNHSFRRGITYGFLGQHNIGDPVIDRNDLNNNKFKQGWIIGFATTDMHAGYCDHIAPRTIRYSSNNHNFNYAIKQWNNAKNYLNNMYNGKYTSFDTYSEQWGSGNNF